MNTARGSRSILHRPRQEKKSPAAKNEARALRDTIAQDAVRALSDAMLEASQDTGASPAISINPSPKPAPNPPSGGEGEEESNPQFPLFSSLPIELRTRIFAVALYLPRVPVTAGIAARRPGSRDRIKWPVLLHVCREAREEAVMFYEGIQGVGGTLKTESNSVVGRMRFKEVKGRNRVMVGEWWWDISVVG